MAKLRAVVTEPQSPLETLWREFPELRNSTVVFRVAMEGRVSRTFRLLDGRYITIVSTKAGNEIEPVPEDEIEVFEAVWQELGSRVHDETMPDTPHGIMFASAEFSERVEVELL